MIISDSNDVKLILQLLNLSFPDSFIPTVDCIFLSYIKGVFLVDLLDEHSSVIKTFLIKDDSYE